MTLDTQGLYRNQTITTSIAPGDVVKGCAFRCRIPERGVWRLRISFDLRVKVSLSGAYVLASVAQDGVEVPGSRAQFEAAAPGQKTTLGRSGIVVRGLTGGTTTIALRAYVTSGSVLCLGDDRGIHIGIEPDVDAARAFVLVCGDSLVKGTAAESQDGFLQPLDGLLWSRVDWLGRKAAESGDDAIRHEGVGGHTAAQGFAALPAALAALDREPSHAVLVYGTNDAAAGRLPADVRADLEAMRDEVVVDTAGAAKIVVVLQPPTNDPTRNAALQAIHNEVRQMSGVEFVDGWSGFDAATMLEPSPGNHPNAAGYDFLARRLAHALL